MKTLKELLVADVSLKTLERRPRVRLPKGSKFMVSIIAPGDDDWPLHRGPKGRAYYVQKTPHWSHRKPWKNEEWVVLSPLETIAWLADHWGDPAIRRDALRLLKGKKGGKRRLTRL